MSLEDDRIQQILQQETPAIVDDWYSVIKASSLSVSSPGETRQLLSCLLQRMCAFLLDEGADPAETMSIGAAFAPLRLEPRAFGRVPAALAQHLLVNLPTDLTTTLGPRLGVLIEGLAAGFVQEDRGNLLTQQERIRDAYVHALQRAEEELLLKDAGIESSINAICLCNREGRVTYVNSAFLRMWGYDRREDVVGRHIADFGRWNYEAATVLEGLDREDGWIGELVARRKDGSCFDVQVSASTVKDEEGRLLQVMNSFVDVTERKRAQETLERRAAQLLMLNRIGDTIATLLTPDKLLETAVHLVRDSFDYHQVAVLTLDQKQEELLVRAIAGSFADELPDEPRVPIERGITGWVARHGETLIANDVSAEPRYFERFDRQVRTRSELAAPIRRGGHVIGVLDVQSPRLDAFTDEDRIALETLADQIAVALENARLYEALQDELAQRRKVEGRLRRHVQRLEMLHDVDQAILVAKSMGEVAEAALRHLRRLVPCQRAGVDLFDFDAGEVLVLAAIQTVGKGMAPAGARFPLTLRDYVFKALEGQQSIYVRDIRELPQSAPFIRIVRQEGLKSFLAAPLRFRGELIGILGLGADRVDGFGVEHRPIVEEVADSVAVAIQQARLLDSVRRQGDRLRDAMARLAEAEEDERRRVVQTLHDRVGQNLTALDLNLSLVRSQVHAHGLHRLCARLDDSLSMVEETNARIRQVMADLRPPVLDDYGLLATLRWYAEQFSSRMGLQVTVQSDLESASSLSAHVENALFRIAQEALHNTAKHAQATEVTIGLSASEAAVLLTISDNGSGFQAEDVRDKRASWGLLTMKERAESVGARCFIQSGPEEGTCVVVEVPR
jgi:PAS domain S-box-containing protein